MTGENGLRGSFFLTGYNLLKRHKIFLINSKSKIHRGYIENRKIYTEFKGFRKKQRMFIKYLTI
jgi:hypothetical protein